MAHKKSCLKVVFEGPVPMLNDNPRLAPVFVNARIGYGGNSRSDYTTPPSREQRCKSPVITYLFCTADKQNVHLQTGHMEIQCAPTSLMPPSFTTATGCSISSMRIVDNRRAPWIAWQQNETTHVMVRALLSNILLNEVKARKGNMQIRKTRSTKT